MASDKKKNVPDVRTGSEGSPALSDERVIEILREISIKYLNELEKFIELCKEADDIFKEGEEEKYEELLSEVSRVFADAQDAFIEELYEKLPVESVDYDGNGATIVLADGRRFSVDWENYLKIWRSSWEAEE